MKIHRSGKYRTQAETFKHETKSCWGTLYPDGGVTLQFGVFFVTMTEMKEYLSEKGEYTITFLDEMQGEETKQ